MTLRSQSHVYLELSEKECNSVNQNINQSIYKLSKQMGDQQINTVELRFLEPPRETKLGLRNREFLNIGGKITEKRIQGKQLLVRVIAGF